MIGPVSGSSASGPLRFPFAVSIVVLTRPGGTRGMIGRPSAIASRCESAVRSLTLRRKYSATAAVCVEESQRAAHPFVIVP